MKKKLSMLLTIPLFVAVLVPSIANAGNVKKSYINIAKEGQQATAADLGNIANNYANINTALVNKTYDAKLGKTAKFVNSVTVENNGGKFGDKVYLFNGTNSYINTEDYATYNAQVTNQVTIEAWIKPNVLNKVGTIVSKTEGGSYDFFLDNTTLYAQLLVSGLTSYKVITYNASSILKVEQWNHVAFSYDGIAMKLFVDGVEKASVAQTGTITNVNTPIFIGAEPTSAGTNPGYDPNRTFNGGIAEVRLWKTGRSPQQIKEHYDKPLKTLESDLVSYWPLNH